MQIHEKYNFTRFVADFGFCQNKAGMTCCVAVLKATFHFSDDGRVSIPGRGEMLPVFLQDQYRDKPDNSSLRYPSDIVHAKKGTDIVINGYAHARGQNKVTAGYRLGSHEKKVTASGERYLDQVMLKETIIGPAPFRRLALTYENAYGGSYEDPHMGRRWYDANPVGIGFEHQKASQRRLPGLAYPNQPNTASGEPKPAAFNAIPPWWRPRTRYSGTFDDDWHHTRRPLLPRDFDHRFYNTVPADQIIEPKLQGGERLALFNLHPRQADLTLEIPCRRFCATFRIKERTEPVPMVIDTLVVEPDDHRFCMSYVSVVAIGDDIKFLKSIHFEEA